MDYDEQRALTDYVWENYGALLTDFERQVAAALRARRPAHVSSSSRFAPSPDWLWANDPRVAAALAEGEDVFRRRVRERVLRSCPERIVVARCPKCGRIVNRPDARVCFWCGHDWHPRG